MKNKISRKDREQSRKLNLIRVITIFVVWGAYELLSHSGLVFQGVVPSSVDVTKSIFSMITDSEFYPHVVRTLTEELAGFGIGTVSGVFIGILFGTMPFLAKMMNPWVLYLAPSPKIIFLPILLLLFGVDMGSKIAISAITAFFPVAIATYTGMLHIKPVYLKVASNFNFSPAQKIAKVYLPALVRPIVASMRLAFGTSFIVTLLAEIKMSNLGLGHLIIQYYEFLEVDKMYAVLILTFIFAMVANGLMGRLSESVRH